MLKDIKPRKGSFYIARLIEEGEHVHQDFKYTISDARKIARSLSAFANNDGGRLLIGVKDNGHVAGVRNEEDIFVVEQAAQMYCRPAQTLKVSAYSVEGGAVVFVVEIERSLNRPVRAQEPNGQWRAYYRVKDENIVAPRLMVDAWLMAASQQGALIALDGAERQLMAMLEDGEAITVSQFVKAAHLSTASAERVVTRLCASGFIDFSYDGSEFLIVARSE